VPGLYGYAAVIFSHEVFLPHMNALSKLVIFSSLIHQLSFCLFSSLPFAIGTVQDAGLIFLSTMSSKLANEILAEGGKDEEIMSTVLVLLSLGTATLGLVLIAMGHFRLAEYVRMRAKFGYLNDGKPTTRSHRSFVLDVPIFSLVQCSVVFTHACRRRLPRFHREFAMREHFICVRSRCTDSSIFSRFSPNRAIFAWKRGSALPSPSQ